MELVIQTDLENDVFYLALSQGALKKGAVKRTQRVDDDVAIDFDQAGRMLGIEIMNASKRIGGRLDEITLDALVGVKEAAAMLGVERSNFIRDYADKPDFPRPVVELASGRVWLRGQIEAYARARAMRARILKSPRLA